MRVLTLTELMRLTRTELSGLAARITAALPTLREGSPQRTAAHINLRNIRLVLARRDLSPQPNIGDPRLCRGGSRSLTFPGVRQGRSEFMRKLSLASIERSQGNEPRKRSNPAMKARFASACGKRGEV
jgi:hypothetical protein